jgi:hypothetical protein
MPLLVMVYTTNAEQTRRLLAVVEGGDVGRTVGVYRMPLAGEPVCAGGTCRSDGWTRAEDGQMVHGCGRRNKRWRKRISTTLMDVFGINRLPRAETPAVFQNPEGWGK